MINSYKSSKIYIVFLYQFRAVYQTKMTIVHFIIIIFSLKLLKVYYKLTTTQIIISHYSSMCVVVISFNIIKVQLQRGLYSSFAYMCITDVYNMCVPIYKEFVNNICCVLRAFSFQDGNFFLITRHI